MSDIASLVEGRRILVCCGSGGVGKTTTAAVLALEGARRGRRAVVVTIDPAKRLADALGMESLSNTAHQIEGDWSGELWALMLDTKSTFDALVAKYSANPEQAQGILDNRFYRNIAGALSGTQEYMAMEKLYELHDEGRFDLIVKGMNGQDRKPPSGGGCRRRAGDRNRSAEPLWEFLCKMPGACAAHAVTGDGNFIFVD